MAPLAGSQEVIQWCNKDRKAWLYDGSHREGINRTIQIEEEQRFFFK